MPIYFLNAMSLRMRPVLKMPVLKKIVKMLIPAACLIIAAFIFAHASPVPERYEFQQMHMGTLVRIVLYSASRERATEASADTFRLISRLDRVCSDYREDSDLTQFSLRAGTGSVAIGQDLFEVLTLSRQWSERTGGVFDVTAAPLIQLWKRARRTRELPDPQRLQSARRLIGYRSLRLDRQRQTASLAKTGMRLDLGGIAKGYAADRALELLAGQGIDRALVAIGGDIVVGEPPPETNGWEIGIAPLDDPKQPARLFLSLRHSAVSTSGDAEQSVTIDGVRYSHIVDPRTGLGVIGHSSATVVARRGATSDVLATTISILGAGEGMRLLDKLSGLDDSLAALVVEEHRQTASLHWASKLRP